MVDPMLVHIDISGGEIYESASRLFATIAYPLDVDARSRFEQALCLHVLKERASADMLWAHTKQAIKPVLLLDQHELEKAHRKGMTVLNEKRMIALQMVSPMYRDYERTKLTGRKQWKTFVRPTSEEMIKGTAATLSFARNWPTPPHKSNTFERCWKSSRPVMHLLLALRAAQPKHGFFVRNQIDLSNYMASRELLRTILQEADDHYHHVGHVCGFPSVELVRITWL